MSALNRTICRMSARNYLWAVNSSFLIVSCTALNDCAASGDTNSLIQHSLKLTADRQTTEVFQSMPLADDDLHMSEAQILAELESAKHARQHFDRRIATLEVLLASSRTTVEESQEKAMESMQPVGTLLQHPRAEPFDPALEHHHRRLFASFVGLLFFAYALFAIRSIMNHERQRGQHEIHWYHDTTCLTQILVGAAGLWLLSGAYCFTELIRFNNQRSLSVSEALYISIQIVTTVGYGDLTPVTDAGKLFMTFYVATGVMLVGTISHQLIVMYIEKAEKKMGDSSSFWREHPGISIAVEAGASIVFGTLFFGLWPGENKTFFESFYISVITLFTVGFGDYHPITPTGQVVASVWMLIGVVLMGRAVVDVSHLIFQDRKYMRSKGAALNFFNDVTTNRKGVIDRVTFLGFELVRNGLVQSSFDSANARFDKFDADGNGVLDFDEFEAYVNKAFSS